jgi:hypothetical protein
MNRYAQFPLSTWRLDRVKGRSDQPPLYAGGEALGLRTGVNSHAAKADRGVDVALR